MMELAKPDIARVLEYYGADLSRVSEVGWSRRKINCVVHDDRNPSMSVHLEDGRVHCWSCGAHGDGYDVIMRKEGLDFNEARKWAADHLGVENKQIRRTPARYVPSWAEPDDD